MVKFSILNEILGYFTQPDKTNTDPRYLVEGSQNVLIKSRRKFGIRKGFTRYGAENTALNACESSYDWETSSNTVLNLRAYDDELEVYAGTVDGVAFNAWSRIKDSWTAVDFSFVPWWDTTEALDGLLFVNGADQIYSWSGGMTSLKSATVNTITKNGTGTWAAARFLTGTGKLGATTKVVINGTEYTYTGGEATTTLTGVTPDPSGEATNSLVTQAVVTHDNEPADGAVNDFIRVARNQLWIGSNTSRAASVSKTTDFADFSESTPRVPGEGATLVLDAVCRGFAVKDDRMYVSAGKRYWYRSRFHELDVGGTLTETLSLEPLKTSIGQAAQSQDLICEMGDLIAFLSYEPALRIIESPEDLENPQLRNLSHPIKPDFDAETFTNGHLKAHRNRIYLSAPTNDVVYINELETDENGNQRRFWQPPQILPVRRFAVIGDDIYGHSNRVPETYKLFDDTDDNGMSFKAVAKLAYNAFGRRDALKTFDEYMFEGYISANTDDLIITFNYDYAGAGQIIERTLDGSKEATLYQAPESGGGLGDQPLGDSPLGDEPETSSGNPKFKTIFEIAPQEFHELQVVLETDGQDKQWDIIAHGAAVSLSLNEDTSHKQ